MGKRSEQTPTKVDIQIANKHVKRCSTSYFIREMQIKTRHHYTPTRMAKIQKTDTTKYWSGYGVTQALTHRWWECKTM